MHRRTLVRASSFVVVKEPWDVNHQLMQTLRRRAAGPAFEDEVDLELGVKK